MRGRYIVIPVGVAGAVIAGASAIAIAGGYRLNLTPSEPLGLWRIEEVQRAVVVGDLVFVCPPDNPDFAEARERGYLRHGLCAGGFAPLIKTVVALDGQRIDVDENVAVDGKPIPASSVRSTDGRGRAIQPFAGGVVSPGHLFLHSTYASSYDSRYFGPIPASGLLGLARPVLTFHP